MPSWGLGEWGIAPWGGGPPAPFDCVAADPPLQIVVRFPAPNETDVSISELVKVAFFDIASDLNLATAYVEIDGKAAYGGGQFLNGFVGQSSFVAGVFALQFVNPLGWPYNTSIPVRAYIENSLGECVDETWSWTTQVDPICYSGLTPNQTELDIQQPLQTFIELEFIRQLLLKSVLKVGRLPITNANNKAARVIYQIAYSTELSTLLNTYATRLDEDLQTTVCEREKAIVTDTSLFKFESRIRASIKTLTNRGLVTREYVNTFNDYLDSTNYNFRVSLVANLIITAKAIELQETNG